MGAQNYRTLAEQNRIRKVPILAPRGKLFDREGRLLVDNYPSVSCFLIREPGRDLRADFPHDLPRPAHDQGAAREPRWPTTRWPPSISPSRLKQDITPDEVEFIEAHRDELPELETIDEQRRLYPRNGFAANLIGYVGEVSDDMLNDPRYAYYEPGDVVGKSGVEQAYDQLLRGQGRFAGHYRGQSRQGSGHPGQGTGRSRPGPQADHRSGSATRRRGGHGRPQRSDGGDGSRIPGAVLALVSRPTFDPNDFSVRVSRDEWNKLVTDPSSSRCWIK